MGGSNSILHIYVFSGATHLFIPFQIHEEVGGGGGEVVLVDDRGGTGIRIN